MREGRAEWLTRRIPPALKIPLARQIQHGSIIVGVTVGVDDGIVVQLVFPQDPYRLLLAGAVALAVAAGQDAVPAVLRVDNVLSRCA